jgi:hypothetical protein
MDDTFEVAVKGAIMAKTTITVITEPRKAAANSLKKRGLLES